MHFLFKVCTDSIKYTTAAHTVFAVMVLKDYFCMVMIDGQQWRSSVGMLQNENIVDSVLARQPMRYAFCVDQQNILPAETIKLSKIVKIPTAIVQCEATCSEKNAGSAKLGESVQIQFFDAHKVNIVEDIVSSSY